jgi:hypothetical protein
MAAVAAHEAQGRADPAWVRRYRARNEFAQRVHVELAAAAGRRVEHVEHVEGVLAEG